MNDKEKADKLDQLVNIIDKTYHHPGNLMWRSFVSGLLSGLGATIGVAVVLTLLGYLLRHLGGLPVIGQWLNDASQILPSHR